MSKHIKVYFCTGCGIGEAIDTEKLTKVSTEESNLPTSIHPFLCSSKGVQLITKDIEQEGLDAIVISACSPRVNWDVFSFNSTIVERVNIREQVAWSHSARDEDTQMLAEDLLRMGITKIKKTNPLEPYLSSVEKAVLVVGGGISGITAALGAANAGYDAILIEKEATLGGWLPKYHKLVPGHPPYANLEEPDITDKCKDVLEHPKVRVLTSAEVEKISGQPGAFTVTVRQDSDTNDIMAGSVILATGWQPYDATKLNNLGFGKYPDVITSVMMEKMAKNNKIVRPSDGKEVKSVAFIQCAGSRDEKHLPYCSSVCCLASLKQAMYIREQNPDANVYIFYKDIRTPGQQEDFYKRVQEDEMIFLTKGEVANVTKDNNDSLVIDIEDTLLGEKIRVNTDVVVLATGMVPATLNSEFLHLQYRKGPELPTLKYGFPDSNFICFPYETQRTGIYAAGCVREPMGLTASTEDATGAALKSIQSLELIERGASLHPRSGDLSYPEIALSRCTQCRRCTEECPFGAYDEDEKGTPLLNLNRCRRCGICMGSCPERIISFKNYSVDQLTSAIKAINVPEEEEEKPRVLVLCCENDAYPAFDMAGTHRLTYNPNIRILPLRCLGSMNVVLIADALSTGIDGIMLVGCKHGDDYQCHFIKGSELANERMEKIQETLTRLALEMERIKFVELSITDYDRIPALVNEFVEELEEMGPNPYKGF